MARTDEIEDYYIRENNKFERASGLVDSIKDSLFPVQYSSDQINGVAFE